MTHLLTGPWGFLPATPEELSATGVVLAVATGLTLDLLGRPALIDGELTSWTSQTLLFLVIAGVGQGHALARAGELRRVVCCLARTEARLGDTELSGRGRHGR